MTEQEASSSLTNLKIFTCNSNIPLAKEICESLGVPLGDADVTKFPNGESFVKINENVRGRDVFVIQSICYPPNQHLMELLIFIDAARRASANRITAVIPFYGYARQDRKDQPRVPITSKLVANLLVSAGADRILTMDLHAQQIVGFFDIPVDHLYASPIFYDYLMKHTDTKNTVVISPDVGGMKMAAAYANILNCPFGVVAKKRIDAAHVEAESLVGDVRGKEVLIVDDMTETAGTLTAAAKIVREHGATKVRACVSHGVLNKYAHERLKGGPIDELITTNSTPVDGGDSGVPVTVISIADLFGKAIMRTHRFESVSSLFRIKPEGESE
ncbi:MAG: ribose-phosphate pyrophosphokinase [Verrucomicrobia bacterium]|nr:ribose-phosphate pyrophosphokinase [Verrucomicrobiota bacterium]MDA1065358.1 ribose-phosphate pyrophosphokinase [Verrucomicrobiota bacterium]